MANVIQWNDLDCHMGDILYEESYLNNEIKKCRLIEYMDITHMKFVYDYDDDEANYESYPVMVKYTPDIRYWDEYPSPDERKNRNWR